MILDLFKLEGKVAVVMGANSGIGQGIAVGMAEAGADIVGVGRSDMSETKGMVEAQLEVRESQCESCGDLCGDEVDCRIWVYEGKEYTVPPKAMIIDAILREVYSGTKVLIENNTSIKGEYELPVNLKNFFQAMERKEI